VTIDGKLARRERRVFHSSPDFISISRLLDGLYIDVNPGFERFTGYRRHEAVGHTSIEIGIWPDAQERQLVVSAMLQAGGELHEFQARLKARNGEIRHVELSASMAGLGDERLFIVIVRDITERHQATVELQPHREHLEALVAQRTAALRETNGELLGTNLQLGQAHARLHHAVRKSDTVARLGGALHALL
jgi:PAS domain S-box-containing protein